LLSLHARLPKEFLFENMSNELTPALILLIIAAYFAVLIGIAWYTSRNDDSNEGFFTAHRSLPWYVVAYAMIGTSISGVTFISIPGKVGAGGLNQSFSYMQMVFGYLAGYLFIATVLMPLYYRLQLTSIYGYLEQRFGSSAYKTGAGFFILSRTLGSAARMYLAAVVLQALVFGPLGVPFVVTVIGMLALIYLYTYKGGLKTIIWTDTIMTTFFLLALVVTVFAIGSALHLGPIDLFGEVMQGRFGKMFFFDNFATDPNHFIKQFVSGALIAIAMTGLDQDLMQKNLACKNIGEAQKNMFWFCVVIVIINFLFLTLGALLYMYASTYGIELPAKSDQLYALIAFKYLPAFAAIFFILGLIGSTYASSDSALTALTTSFCIDFLQFEKRSKAAQGDLKIEKRLKRERTLTHLGFSVAFLLLILLLHKWNDDAVINLIFRIAGYTYGPLLGLFMFGLFTKIPIRDKYIPIVCIAAPFITYQLESFAKLELKADLGFLIILINGLITFVGLLLLIDTFKSAKVAEEPNR
jgi:Na+/proline symporter